ncbi:MAG: SCO family protein [Halioglobus sp.]|nr:SCO family protein [Halioglobus sp.]
MTANHPSPDNARQSRGVRVTLAAIVVFMLLVVAGFVYRMQQPQVLSPAEMKANGLFLLDTPRDIGDFALVDHRAQAFGPQQLSGHWTLVFFGFTHCPDICPTTMAFLNEFVSGLEDAEAAATEVVMVSVDPERDTVARLAEYVPYFNPEFTGVTGDFLAVQRFATALNAPFRKAPGQGDDYQVDHSASVVLINPRGDYHGFFRAPLDRARMTLTYRAARALWDR